MAAAQLIDDYVSALDRRLFGPRRIKRDLLTEARDSLVDAAEAYEAQGVDREAAVRRAVNEFGPPARIAPAYQAELAANVARRLAVLVAVVPAGAMLFGDQMWKGSPWDGTKPPGDYLIVARSLDWLTYVLAVSAVVIFVALRRQARTGGDPRRLCRAIGIGTLATLGLTMTLGSAIYIFTVSLAPAALTWPPMIIGGVVLTAVHGWQIAAAISCLRAARAMDAGAVPTPVPAG